MLKTLPIAQFLSAYWQDDSILIDVRAPKEFGKGHIPGAINIPLFDDDERTIVGTLYKQQGRNEAFLKALQLVGPKMEGFVRELQNQGQTRKILLHCWRGGMRSQSMGMLWQMAGFEVSTLQGGYKAYRQEVQGIFAQAWELRIIGGSSGCGKTDILAALRQHDEQVLDLEGIAHHRGSAFGGIGLQEQPSVEQFENDCYETLRKFDRTKPLWVEDESHAIGRVYIPLSFWEQMKVASIYVLDLPYHLRAERLIKEYGAYPPSAAKNALERIKKRLGGKSYQDALAAIEARDLHKVVALTLAYYDKAYLHALSKRKGGSKRHLSLNEDQPSQTAQLLLNLNTRQIITE